MRLLPALLVASALIPFTVSAAPRETVIVASYNIRVDLEMDVPGGNGWKTRNEHVAALLQFHDFDLVGLQEATHGQLLDLLANGVYGSVGVGRDDGKEAGESSAILYRKDRFRLLDGGTFWLSQTPDVVSFGWDAVKYHRVCTWAKFEDRVTHGIFQMWNSHFDHEAVVARRNSAKLILERLKPALDAQVPVIVSGDLNATPDSEPYKILASGLLDTRLLSKTPPYGPAGTFNGFDYLGNFDARIDHIFVNQGFSVLRHGTLTDSNAHHFPSDHFPVVTELVLPVSVAK